MCSELDSASSVWPVCGQAQLVGSHLAVSKAFFVVYVFSQAARKTGVGVHEAGTRKFTTVLSSNHAHRTPARKKAHSLGQAATLSTDDDVR